MSLPAAGTGGGGVYPTTFPLGPALSPLNVVSLPPGASVVTEIKLHGLSHSYINDLQFVLTDPSGGMHNVLTRPNSAAGATFSCDFAGDYTLVPLGPCALPYPSSCTLGELEPGSYAQDFGNWPDGTAGVFNTPLETIPAATGVWLLTAYDWASADVGTLASWDLCFGTDPTGQSYPTIAPTPLAPIGGTVTSAPVTLSWSPLNCATSYDVVVNGFPFTGIVGTSFTLSPSPGLHQWRVRGVNGAVPGIYSAYEPFVVSTPPACVPGGGGGAVPATGTGGSGSVWPTVLPAGEFSSTYAVTVPTGVYQLMKVRLHGFSHTWAGDIQIVLDDPTGGRHNLVCRPQSVGGSVGLNCDFDGTDYEIFESGQAPLPTVCPGVAFPGGSYDQSFGDWTSGDHGIFNTPLGAIPVSSGTWKLSIYDWASGDSGALLGWELCFDGTIGNPLTYCTAGVSTNSCSPTISATAQPSASSASTCVISVSNLEGNKSGLIFYGVNNVGFTPSPWSAGSTSYLCVKAPTQRLTTQSTGGSSGACNGTLAQSWNGFQGGNPSSLGNPFSVGDKVYAQAWYRDPPAPKTTNLSNAIELTMLP